MKNKHLRILIIALALVMMFSAFAFAGKNGEHEHKWSYTVNGKTITAACSCGEKATVTIDTNSVYEMARNYDGGDVEYEVVREDHWHEKAGIAEYYILYSGYEVDANGNTDKYTDVYHKPDSNGNYTVRIAIFEDDDPDDGKELYTTENVPYYLAMLTNYRVTSYGLNEISRLADRKPAKDSDGFYHVYSKEEFLWVYYCDPNGSICLENDIVLNPIVVTDDDYLVSSQPLVYQFWGFGQSDEQRYSGVINGNGHFIFGIYCKGEREYDSGGLVAFMDGRGQVRDIILDNFYIQAEHAGSVCGDLRIFADCDREDNFVNCTALNGYISSSGEGDDAGCGGICGYIYPHWNFDQANSSYDVGFVNCRSAATVFGANTNCGGIIGYVDVCGIFMYDCYNFGRINGRDAGGVIGTLYLETDPIRWLWNDPIQTAPHGGRMDQVQNTGTVEGRKYAGGIIGCHRNFQWKYDKTELLINSSSNMGTIRGTKDTYIGGVIGGLGTGRVDLFNIWYFGVDKPYTLLDESDVVGINPDRGYASAAKANVSSKASACKHSYAIPSPSPVWTVKRKATCTRDGIMVQKCLVCGEELNAQAIPATGHNFDGGECCIYCGESELNDSVGSIIVKPGAIGFIAAVVVIAVGAAVVVARKKKRNNA